MTLSKSAEQKYYLLSPCQVTVCFCTLSRTKAKEALMLCLPSWHQTRYIVHRHQVSEPGSHYGGTRLLQL